MICLGEWVLAMELRNSERGLSTVWIPKIKSLTKYLLCLNIISIFLI